MKKIKTLGIVRLLIIVVVINTSCKKTKNCPAFDPNDLHLIPYSANNAISFTSQMNDTICIHLKDFKLSESYSESYKGIFKEPACINSATLPATASASSSEFDFLVLEQSTDSEMQYYKYQLLDFYFEIDFVNEVPYIDDFDYMELIPSLQINGTSYLKVVWYKDLQNISSKIQSVYLNQSNGILRYIDQSGIEWDMVD